MANFYLDIKSDFKPYTFEEMLKPVALEDAYHKQLEEEYALLDSQLSSAMTPKDTKPLDPTRGLLSTLEGSPLDQDSYDIIDLYKDDLQEASNSLVRDGLNPYSRGVFNNLRKRYSEEVLPISAAYNNRIAKATALQDLVKKDPTFVAEYNPMNYSLSEYVNNPALDHGRGFSKKDLTDTVKTFAESFAKADTSLLSKYGVKIPGHTMTSYRKGFTPQEIEEARQTYYAGENSKNPRIQALIEMVRNAVKTTTADEWQDGGRGKREAEEAAWQGAYASLGGRTYDHYVNPYDKPDSSRGGKDKPIFDTAGPSYAMNNDLVKATEEQMNKGQAFRSSVEHLTDPVAGNVHRELFIGESTQRLPVSPEEKAITTLRDEYWNSLGSSSEGDILKSGDFNRIKYIKTLKDGLTTFKKELDNLSEKDKQAILNSFSLEESISNLSEKNKQGVRKSFDGSVYKYDTKQILNVKNQYLKQFGMSEISGEVLDVLNKNLKGNISDVIDTVNRAYENLEYDEEVGYYDQVLKDASKAFDDFISNEEYKKFIEEVEGIKITEADGEFYVNGKLVGVPLPKQGKTRSSVLRNDESYKNYLRQKSDNAKKFIKEVLVPLSETVDNSENYVGSSWGINSNATSHIQMIPHLVRRSLDWGSTKGEGFSAFKDKRGKQLTKQQAYNMARGVQYIVNDDGELVLAEDSPVTEQNISQAQPADFNSTYPKLDLDKNSISFYPGLNQNEGIFMDIDDFIYNIKNTSYYRILSQFVKNPKTNKYVHYKYNSDGKLEAFVLARNSNGELERRNPKDFADVFYKIFEDENAKRVKGETTTKSNK